MVKVVRNMCKMDDESTQIMYNMWDESAKNLYTMVSEIGKRCV